MIIITLSFNPNNIVYMNNFIFCKQLVESVFCLLPAIFFFLFIYKIHTKSFLAESNMFDGRTLHARFATNTLNLFVCRIQMFNGLPMYSVRPSVYNILYNIIFVYNMSADHAIHKFIYYY